MSSYSSLDIERCRSTSGATAYAAYGIDTQGFGQWISRAKREKDGE